MNGLAWNESGKTRRHAVHWPLTMSWREQLAAEAESATRNAGTGAELARAVRALARVAYGHMEGAAPGELLLADGEAVARKLAAVFALSDSEAKLLHEVSGGEEEDDDKNAMNAADITSLRKLAVRLIQYTRRTRRSPAASERLRSRHC